MRSAPELTVAVVTWNSERHIAPLAAGLPAALEGEPSWRLVIADNASTDGTLAAVRRHLPRADVIRSPGNAGYAAGVNSVLRHHPPSRALLVLNPDVRLHPGAVRRLSLALADTGAGVVVPRLEAPDGSLHLSLRREPSVTRVWGEALLGGGRAGRYDALGEVIVDGARYRTGTSADWATGAAMLVSASCLAAVGDFDESFFLYSEETEFCLRARDAGFSLRYVPDAVVTHEGGESNTSPALYALLTSNRVRLFASRNGRLRTGAFWAGLVLGEALRAARGPTHRAALHALLRGLTPPPAPSAHAHAPPEAART